jgi:recombination protein RecT
MAKTDSVKAELAQRAADTPVRGCPIDTVVDLIYALTPEMRKALPAHLDADRMARIATTMVRLNPTLQRCTKESFLGALMTCAQLGLEPGPTGEAWFVPFRNAKTGTHEVQFIIGYEGFIKLILQSGLVRSVMARTVYANDQFEVRYGLHEDCEHRPVMFGDRGEPVAYYAVATLISGGHAFVVLSRSDVDAVRARSKAASSGPWVTDYDAMAMKTAVRRLAKWLPKSPTLATALASEGQVRTVAGPADLMPAALEEIAVSAAGAQDREGEGVAE